MDDYSVKHVAIIPDGNRRWAKARGKMPWDGHRAGFKSFENILKKALDLNVYCLSFWGMSVDNFKKRDPREVRVLLTIFREMMKRAQADTNLKKNDVRITVLGEWKRQFPGALARLFDKVIDETKERKRHILNLLLCYDGKAEMMKAFRSAISGKQQFSSPKDFLMTRDLPPVDLVIRTGGDPHLSSGFMMWDVADAHLSFTDKLWPEFSEGDFEAAISDFKSRERRFGA